MSARLLLVCCALSALLGVGLARTLAVPATVSQAGAPSPVRMISIGKLKFTNYDYVPVAFERCPKNPFGRNKRGHPLSLEWPIGLVFTGDATLAKIGKLMHEPWPQVGSDACEPLVDAHGRTHWVRSKGVKTDSCSPLVTLSSTPLDLHIRLYGPKDSHDPLYRSLKSPQLGHWVVGAAHMDKDDCPFLSQPSLAFFGPDFTEGFTAYYLWYIKGCEIHAQRFNLGNKNAAARGNTLSINDGLATQIVIPKNLSKDSSGFWYCSLNRARKHREQGRHR